MNRKHPPKIYGGWNPQIALRVLKASGRPNGRRAEKL